MLRKNPAAKKEIKFKSLRARIMELDYNLSDIARILNISEAAFSRKITGKNDFKASEIEKIVNLLQIPADRIDEFFFPNIYEKRRLPVNT